MDSDGNLAKIHEEWRAKCIGEGTYRPFTEEEFQAALARWKAECNRPPKKTRQRKHPPKGHAD